MQVFLLWKKLCRKWHSCHTEAFDEQTQWEVEKSEITAMYTAGHRKSGHGGIFLGFCSILKNHTSFFCYSFKLLSGRKTKLLAS